MRWGSMIKRKACFIVVILPCAAVYYCLKFTFRAVEETLDVVYTARQQHRVKTRKRPKSKPLAVVPSVSKSKSKGTPASPPTKTSFLHLPPEIRLMIYRLVLGGPAIMQVRPTYSVRGPRPDAWASRQGIRDDADEPSKALRLTIGLGGSPLRQLVSPPRAGCVVYGCVSQLICGETHYLGLTRYRRDEMVYYTDLMRTSRVVYVEALDLLYAEHTISLFGVEMARYFCRNASPEGMKRVRFAHVALIIPSSSWSSPLHKRSVKDSMKLLRDSLPHLQQLDVEVAVVWGQPKNAGRFWSWLTGDGVLGQFGGLEKFVLKASAYVPFTRRPYGNWAAWTPQYELLESWDDGEYQALKARVTSLDEAVVSS
ncbi:hypothetical protein F5Y00DRAFT_272885 [Daldinia vernicosa]|uniref:uncharacterized protein n=1 Tax=Daldinia vernicosa TaxID=114800 RepID=UPI0020085909|nr:uncharacterized protein F5Y00DRAFT_272885 [Daldinia vernicosa]KAI0845486.1 hypothetical protein F5Y00DRAFT_272885 [Daldinia vernicosa]